MSNYVNLMDVIYPVGSIYQSMSSTSPASTIGGTWEQIKTFLYGSTSAGSTGGEATHTLTNDEMPKHRHTTRVAVTNGGNAATYRSLFATNSTFWNGGSTIDGSAGWDWNNPVSNQGGASSQQFATIYSLLHLAQNSLAVPDSKALSEVA